MFTLEELVSERNQNQAFEYLGTKYKGFYLSGWLGEYELIGEPKYMDLLYQTGLGSKMPRASECSKWQKKSVYLQNPYKIGVCSTFRIGKQVKNRQKRRIFKKKVGRGFS